MIRLALATAAILAVLPAAHAQRRVDDPRSRLPEAVNRIERETGGRVLSAERRTRGGREVSRIKVYTPDGRVRIMWDDPQRDRPASGERGTRGTAVVPRTGVPGVDTAVVHRDLRPEQNPLPESPARRDDGSPRD